MKIGIVDYSIGNVQSLSNALNLYDIEVILTSDKEKIMEADGLILPGVGAYGKAMEELKKRNLQNTLKEYIDTGKPLLGICLGMQLLLEDSEEFGNNEGLGFIKGSVKKFPPTIEGKLPHVSWNELIKKEISWKNTILSNTQTNQDFYFVHSFICLPSNPETILAVTNYGDFEFCSVLKQDNVYGCQFHPEKSSFCGLKILENFIKVSTK